MPTSRHRSQPSTAGPSSSTIWRTSGSVLASSHASTPAISASSGSSLTDAGDDLDQPSGEVDLDRLEHRGEQFGLVAELVIERASCDAGGECHAFGADLGVAVLGEQGTRRGDERGPGGGSAVGLRTSDRRHVDIHAVCM